MKTTSTILIGCVGLLMVTGLGIAGTGISSHVQQISPMRQDSITVPPLNDVPRHATPPTASSPAGEGTVQSVSPNPISEPASARSYDPSGRRDPFVPVLQQLGLGPIDPTLPPVQRVGLTEMNLIAVIWGAYGIRRWFRRQMGMDIRCVEERGSVLIMAW